MAFYGNTPTATASVSANTNVVTIAGIDLSLVTPGMTISFGARDRETGDRWLIGSVSPTGSNGGTVTTQGSIPTAFSNVPFLINTTGYLGTDASYAAAVGLAILNTLSTLLGVATNLYSGARQLVLDKVAASALSRIVFSIAGRPWGDLVQRSFAFTPTGGQATTIETLAVRAFSDGSTPSDALLFDLSGGTGDLRKGSATMGAATTVDLGSAPMGKVALTGGGGVNIASFGAGKHLERIVHVVDGGATLVHNAASLNLPTGANIVTRAGDRFHATSDGSGNWRVVGYHRADGTPLALPTLARRPSFRNRIINGNFLVDARGTASAATNYSGGAYTRDRWKAGGSGANVGFSVSGGDVIATVQTGGSLAQVIEGGLYLLEGGTYTLSWVGTAKASINGGVYASSPITVTGLPIGANATIEFTSGTVGQVQFEPGAEATPFERRDDEWRRCQRYIRRVPNTLGYWYGNTTSFNFTLQLDGMRAAPSFVLANAGQGVITQNRGIYAISGIASAQVSGPQVLLDLTTAAANTFQPGYILNDVVIFAVAEL